MVLEMLEILQSEQCKVGGLGTHRSGGQMGTWVWDDRQEEEYMDRGDQGLLGG